MRKPITERALLARVNRKLKKEFLSVKRCHWDSKWFNELGRYYTVNELANRIEDKHINLEVLAKEYGAIKPYEVLEGT